MTREIKENLRSISKEYVLRQVQHFGAGSVRPTELNRAIEKVNKALIEVRAVQMPSKKK